MNKKNLREVLSSEGLISQRVAADYSADLKGLKEITSFLSARDKMRDQFFELAESSDSEQGYGVVDILSVRFLGESLRIRDRRYPGSIFQGVEAVTVDDRDDEFETEIKLPGWSWCSCRSSRRSCSHIKALAVEQGNMIEDENAKLRSQFERLVDEVRSLIPVS
jgi:hypothetical protein